MNPWKNFSRSNELCRDRARDVGLFAFCTERPRDSGARTVLGKWIQPD